MMRIGGLRSRRGRRVRGSLRVEGVQIPVAVMEGARPGPAMYLQALQHPTEVMGVEVVRRVMEELDLGKLRGTVVVSPIANPVHAAWANGLAKHRHLVSAGQKKRLGRINSNRVWPGRAEGNLIERMMHAIFENICRQVDAIVDLHCCRLCDHYFAAARDGHAGSEALAKAFGAPLVDLQDEESYAKGLLFLVAPPLIDAASILVEMSPGRDVTYEMVENGVRGVHNMLKHLGMLAGRPELPKRQVVVRRADPVRVFRAKKEGYLTTYRRVGEPVKKGRRLCEVRGLDRFEVVQTVRAPYEGTAPSVGPGSELRMVKVGEEICTFKRVVEVVRN
jgi:predicted deacylase